MRARDVRFQSAATRAKGRRCQVIPLLKADERGFLLWAAFLEIWRKRLSNEYMLLGLRWGFFWGTQVREDKLLVLRADWEIPEDLHAQPHWHANQHSCFEIDAPAEIGPTSAEFEGLLELALEGVHLPMGGWWHEGAGSAGWCPPVSDIGDLERWNAALLECVLREAPGITRQYASYAST